MDEAALNERGCVWIEKLFKIDELCSQGLSLAVKFKAKEYTIL